MRSFINGCAVLGVGWAAVLAGCAGPDLVVGENSPKAGAPGGGAGGAVTESGGTGGAAQGGDTMGAGAVGGAMNAAGRASGGSAGVGNAASGAVGGATGGGGSSSGTNTAGDQSGAGSSSVSTTTSVYVSQIRYTGDVNFEDPATVKCLPRPLSAAESDTKIYRVSMTQCACDAPGFGPMTVGVRATAETYLATMGMCGYDGGPACSDYCMCEEFPAAGALRDSCLNDVTEPDAESGWCYVSPEQGLGNPELVAGCSRTQRRVLRFLGEQGSNPDNLHLIMAANHYDVETTTPPGHLPPGSPCLPEAERLPDFNGFSLSEVSVNLNNAACDSGLCLVNHFQGRVSCPYGQLQDELDQSTCFLPGSDEVVTVPVDSQRVARQSAEASICSCQCDGPGKGPFCACPSDMECSPLVPATGVPALDAATGSYCIPKGTAYDPTYPTAQDTCFFTAMTTADPTPCGPARPY